MGDADKVMAVGMWGNVVGSSSIGSWHMGDLFLGVIVLAVGI